MVVDLTLLAMGLTALIGIGGAVFGVQFKGKYQQALVAMGETATLLGLLAGVISEISEALKDDTLTPDELESVKKKLVKVQGVLQAVQAGLMK